MNPQPLRDAADILATLTAAGCQVRAEGDALHVYDPGKALTDDLRQSIRRHKLAILALLLRDALQRLLQVLDMAQPPIPVGMQEDFASAWLGAIQVIGEPWEKEPEFDLWQE